jgi:hypothetical protein
MPDNPALFEEVKALLELPLNFGLVAATPSHFVVAFVLLEGVSAGQAFALTLHLDPADYPQSPSVVKLEPQVAGKDLETGGVMLADICRLVEKVRASRAEGLCVF